MAAAGHTNAQDTHSPVQQYPEQTVGVISFWCWFANHWANPMLQSRARIYAHQRDDFVARARQLHTICASVSKLNNFYWTRNMPTFLGGISPLGRSCCAELIFQLENHDPRAVLGRGKLSPMKFHVTFSSANKSSPPRQLNQTAHQSQNFISLAS